MMVAFAIKVVRTRPYDQKTLLKASGAQEAACPEALRIELLHDMRLLWPQREGIVMEYMVRTWKDVA